MRLLFVTPSLPAASGRGYELIAYHQIEGLSQCHTVDLISLTKSKRGNSDLGRLSDWCENVITVGLPAWRSILNSGLGIPFDCPLQVFYYKSRRMADRMGSELRQRRYDVVVFQLTRMAQYRPNWYEGPTVLNMVDPFALNYQRSLRWRPWRTRLAWRLEIRRLLRYEPKVARRFDRVLLISEADMADYKGFLRGATVDWVPHGVDERRFCPSPEVTRQPGMIVMTGNMFYAPNVDAVEFFCREVLPIIRVRVPSATLWLVGARPAPGVRRWAANDGIKVTGSVPDVRPYLNQAMVSVCPVRLNVGTQTKVLEALAMGTPVVTTAAGNRGVRGTHTVHLQVADEPEEFADRVVELLNGHRWNELSENGRGFVAENFTWDKSTSRLEGILQQVVNQRSMSH